MRAVEVSGGARVLLGAANDASLYVWELYGRHPPMQRMIAVCFFGTVRGTGHSAHRAPHPYALHCRRHSHVRRLRL